jgi:hypothetical protein
MAPKNQRFNVELMQFAALLLEKTARHSARLKPNLIQLPRRARR